jgi:hypothetical protein
VRGDGRERRGDHPGVVAKADGREGIRHRVGGEDEVAERAVDGGLGPSERARFQRGVVEPERLFEHAVADGLGMEVHPFQKRLGEKCEANVEKFIGAGRRLRERSVCPQWKPAPSGRFGLLHSARALRNDGPPRERPPAANEATGGRGCYRSVAARSSAYRGSLATRCKRRPGLCIGGFNPLSIEEVL